MNEEIGRFHQSFHISLSNEPLYYLEVSKRNRLFSDDLKGETK